MSAKPYSRCLSSKAIRYGRAAAGAALVAGLAAGTGLVAGSTASAANALVEPPVFASQNHRLDLLMIASARTVKLTDDVETTAWPYEVCYRPTSTAAPNDCGGTGVAPLGGVRLQLQQGDTLRIRLVNKLPPVPDAKHAEENPDLVNNPTNLHTHGLIVEPHRAEGPRDTYGDYVFVVVRNPENGAAPDSAMADGSMHMQHIHPDMDFVDGAVEYKIDIGDNHPSGLFWFHPHMHGVSLNQVSAGMSGIITIGAATDMCTDAACRAAMEAGNIRHLVLKDMQVERDGTLLTQEDPAFCNGQPDSTEAPRQGVCAGQTTDDGDHTGGHWFNTVNGQVYPQIDVGPSGDTWRIVNASGSRSYELSLTDDATGNPLPLQVLAIDGVTVDSAQPGANMARLRKLMGNKVLPEPCPGPLDKVLQGDNICTSHVRMMPSSRVELRVLRRDNGAQDATATLRTNDYFTGGDDWPAIDLAKVKLAPRHAWAVDFLSIGGQATAALSDGGALRGVAELQVPGTAKPVSLASARALDGAPTAGPLLQAGMRQAPTIAIDTALKLGKRVDPACQPLAPGHRRKILFGNPTPGEDGFGLGYVEVDEQGRDIESTRKPIRVFDPSETTICVPLKANGRSVSEVWELVNLTDEDHNFHIHQTRFHVITGGTIPGTTIPARVEDALVLHDNLPLPHAANTDGCDGTVEAVKSGACQPPVAVVQIPFREVGDFVFHCHILEHEDGGMMARIRVVGAPGA